MLACRLCLAFGEQDPEQWLENCPPRVLNVWRAFAEADSWSMKRRLETTQAIVAKKLLASKYKKDDRLEALESLDKIVESIMPVDWRIEEDGEQKSIDQGLLLVMNRGGGEALKTPLYSLEIEVDPWQQQ